MISTWFLAVMTGIYVFGMITMGFTLGSKNREISRLERSLRLERDTSGRRQKRTKIPVKALIPGHVIIDRTVRVAVETAPRPSTGNSVYFAVTPMDVIGGMYTTSYDSEDVLVEVEVDSE